MFSSIKSFGVSGVGGYSVAVEVYISYGMPGFEIVGLPDAAVKEARERVRAAIKNNGFRFPVSRMTVNLAPAGKKKAGTVYDLPIFVGLLAAAGELPAPPQDAAFIGELSLTGALRGEGTVVIGDHVDDPTAGVEGQGDSSAQVYDDQILAVVGKMVLLAVFQSGGAHIQVVALTVAADFLDAGDPDQLNHFVHGDGVVNVGFDAQLRGHPVGNGSAQVGSVLIDRMMLQNIQHILRHFVGTGMDRGQKATPRHDGRQRGGVHIVAFQHLSNDLNAKIKLRQDGGEGLQILCGMLDVFLPQLFVLPKKSNFRGGGAGIDDKNLSHLFPPMAIRAAMTME